MLAGEHRGNTIYLHMANRSSYFLRKGQENDASTGNPKSLDFWSVLSECIWEFQMLKHAKEILDLFVNLSKIQSWLITLKLPLSFLDSFTHYRLDLKYASQVNRFWTPL